MQNQRVRRTAAQTLASVLLGEDVMKWLGRKHDELGSWEAANEAMTTATNGQVHVSNRTVHNWLSAARDEHSAGGAETRSHRESAVA